MSVYRPKKSRFYQFDFQVGGQRFYGSTNCTSRREAEKFEERERESAEAEVKARRAGSVERLTLSAAAAKFYLEVGQYLKGDGPKNLRWSIAWLESEIGPDKLLSAIDDQLVSRIVSVRRGQKTKHGKLVTNATVNRSVVEPLRKILRYAAETGKQPVGAVNWRKRLLKEPKERVRELTVAEECRLFESLRPDYHDVVRFALLAGCRLCEIVPGKEFPGLRWSDVDWGTRTIALLGKGRNVDRIPISSKLRELIFPLQGQHPVYVFSYVSQRSDQKKQRRRGERYPITREGLKTAWRRSKLDAELIDYRFHDNRHTAATSVLRATGNLKIVQRLLRHSDISTTAKYAHALDDDVRRGLDAGEESRNESRNSVNENSNRMNTKGKSD